MSCSDSWTSSYAISWGPPAGPGPVALNRYTGSHDSLQYAIGGTDNRPRTSRRDDSRTAPPCHGLPDAGVHAPGGVRPRSEELGVVNLEPRERFRPQRLRLSHAYFQRRFRNDVAAAFDQIPQPAQLFDARSGFLIDPERHGQRLRGRGVGAQRVSYRAIALRQQAGVRQHADRRIRTEKARLEADALDLGVCDMPLGTCQQ